MTLGVDITSPAGALRAALEALSDALAEDEQWRRCQCARAAQDYAATVALHADSTAAQVRDARECLALATDLDEETKRHHARLRTRGQRTRKVYRPPESAIA